VGVLAARRVGADARPVRAAPGAASRAGRAPLVEPALFGSRAFTGGLVVGLFFFGGLVGFTLTIGLYLQLALGFTALEAGLAQAPWALGVAIGATVSGAVLARRFGRPVIQVGAVVVAFGLAGVLLTLTVADGPVTAWQRRSSMSCSPG
jgi:hypothetical protein